MSSIQEYLPNGHHGRTISGPRSLWSFLVPGAERAFAVLLQWQERSAQRHHLAALEGRHLKDMGLSRADVEKETRKPFWRP